MVFFVHLSCLQAALRALHLSLEIVGAFHDVVSYLLAFAQLGNSPNSFCALNPEPLTPDWGGTERIGKLQILHVQDRFLRVRKMSVKC